MLDYKFYRYPGEHSKEMPLDNYDLNAAKWISVYVELPLDEMISVKQPELYERYGRWLEAEDQNLAPHLAKQNCYQAKLIDLITAQVEKENKEEEEHYQAPKGIGIVPGAAAPVNRMMESSRQAAQDRLRGNSDQEESSSGDQNFESDEDQ